MSLARHNLRAARMALDRARAAEGADCHLAARGHQAVILAGSDAMPGAGGMKVQGQEGAPVAPVPNLHRRVLREQS